jgi:hypothetical protein
MIAEQTDPTNEPLRTNTDSPNWKVAALAATSIWILAVGAGVLVSLF